MNSSHYSSSLGHFDHYNVNDLEKQLPEYRWCPYNDSIIIPISQDAEDAALQDSAQPEDDPDIENAIGQHHIDFAVTESPVYSTNDYYNSLISYYMNMCNSDYTLLDFDFRD